MFNLKREPRFVWIEFMMFQCDNTAHSFDFVKMTLTIEIDEIVTFALSTSYRFLVKYLICSALPYSFRFKSTTNCPTHIKKQKLSECNKMKQNQTKQKTPWMRLEILSELFVSCWFKSQRKTSRIVNCKILSGRLNIYPLMAIEMKRIETFVRIQRIEYMAFNSRIIMNFTAN